MSIDLQDPGHAVPPIPGAYERNTLTYRQPGSMGADTSVAVPVGSSSMDAATIAEREREGGGGPSQRRRRVDAQRTGPKAGFGFDEAALEAARRASFTPGSTRDGVRLKMWTSLRVSFQPGR